ncbi:Isg20l2 [Columba livia]|nr:Isg20l2 [Columba livia]
MAAKRASPSTAVTDKPRPKAKKRERWPWGGHVLSLILRILAGKVVVGHAIYNDFKALKYFHPKELTRDTSKIPLLNRRGGFPENVAISLKRLVKELLHKDIQVGKSGHSSVEDARATMELYKVVEAEWEQHLLLNPEQE